MEEIFNRALALHRAWRLDEAEALYRQVVDGQARDWRPGWALGNLGKLLRVSGRLDEAEAVLREALAVDPGNLSVRHALGMTLLGAGKYAEGWRCYEARLAIYPTNYPPLPFPEWKGESLAGKRVLVLPEQGLGDQILLSRFTLKLAEQAEEVDTICARTLLPLLSRLPVRFFYPEDWSGLSYDYWTLMASVPGHLGLGPQDAPAPYLPTSDRHEAGAGLMLQGAARNDNNANRLPSPAVERAIRGLARFTDLAPEVSGARDFGETAEIVAGLQLVVTVDTSVAHLCGAMGKRALVLLSRPAIDWYASWQDERTPWYPSLRLIRQDRQGNWAGVIARLAQELEAEGLAV